MPKIPSYTLAWSPGTEAYELYEPRHRGVLSIVPDSPEWFAWLEQVSSFAFSGKSGHYTARKETKQRGALYWYAYRKTQGKLAKKYLGKTADLTLALLEEVAGLLPAERATAASRRESATVSPAPQETALPHSTRSLASMASTTSGDGGCGVRNTSRAVVPSCASRVCRAAIR